jgi:hypothetical protein
MSEFRDEPHFFRARTALCVRILDEFNRHVLS